MGLLLRLLLLLIPQPPRELASIDLTMDLTAETTKVVILMIAFMAASTFGRELQQIVVNMQLNSSSIDQGEVLYTFQNQSVYQIIHGKGCPQDTIDIGGMESQQSRSVVTQKTLRFDGGLDTFTPFCAVPSVGAIALESYSCSIAINNQLGISLIINIVPTFFATAVTFPLAFYSGSVVEEMENVVVSIRAHSKLAIQTSPLPNLFLPQYRLEGDGTSMFRVYEEREGCSSLPVIETTSSLNREVQNYWELTLVAFAPHAPTTLTSSTVIGISVLDANNSPPQITSELSQVHVTSNVLPGSGITRFRASDSDAGINAAVLFSTVNLSSYLTIHPLSGAVFLFQSISQENLVNLSVHIIAEDRGEPALVSLPQELEIFINRSNSSSLHQLLIHGTGGQSNLYVVSEMAPVGFQVATVELHGENLDHLIILLENVGPCECFNLSHPITNADHIQFNILVAHELDFEKSRGKYQLRVFRNDDHMIMESHFIEVIVTDVNERPAFDSSMYNFRITEGVPIGTLIGRVFADDQDNGYNGTLTYTIVNQTPLGFLIVEEHSGFLQSMSEIDYEMTQTITATVMAEDGSGLTASTTVNINILDGNDNQPVFSLDSTNASITIAETSNRDQVLFAFSAEDADSGCNGALEYSIFYADPNVFYIEPSSGLLYPLSSTSLDFEKFSTATIVVHATDLGEPVRFTAEAVLHLQLTEVNDEAPVIDSVGCPCFITENAPVGSTQAKCPPLSAHDPDSSVLTFSIDFTLSPSVPFQIDASSGILSALIPLDRETSSEYQVAVVVTDEMTHRSLPELLTVRVIDINDQPPEFSKSSLDLIVPSDLSPGDYVADLSARDGDIGYNSIVIYNFTSGTPSQILNMFNLDPLSGILHTKQQLTMNRYVFTVSANDYLMVLSRDELSVTITVSGPKNNPPSFRLPVDHRIISEDLGTGFQVAMFSASDSDQGANGEITYSIITPSSNLSDLFALQSNGRLTLSQSLTGRAGDTYVVNVSASDGGRPPLVDYQQLVVRVYARDYILSSQQLVYNPGVEACHYSGSVSEATGGDELVIQELTSPIDSTTVHYTALDGPNSAAPFSIATTTLRTMTGFASVFNNTDAVFISLLAQYGSNFFLCSVTVFIDDTNNNPPYFSSNVFSFEAYSSTPVGTSLTKLQTFDNDFFIDNSRASFAIVSSDVPFEIASSTGVITVSQPLSPSTEYMFTVAAVDPGLPSMTSTAEIRVFILNTSNSAPIFVDGDIALEYSEVLNSTTPPRVLQISDMDGNVNVQSINTFCIASGNSRNTFTITDNGILRPNHLDFETVSDFNLTVVAYDNSLNPSYSSAEVKIRILDENEPPMFSVPVYNASLREDASVGLRVIAVAASDNDSGSSGSITYAIPSSELFRIDGRTGTITLKNAITSPGIIRFNVTATDEGSPPQTAMAEVHVYIVDVNNNPPVFTEASRNVNVPENVAVGYEVFRVSEVTSDADIGANSAIRYAIVSGNINVTFSLDPWSGSLRTARELDYETLSVYNLAIGASDLGSPNTSPATGTLAVTIQVANSNDNFPTFSSTEYICTISEQASAFQSPCQVSATDADGDSIVFSFLNSPSNTFMIDSSSGAVTPRSRVPSKDVLNEPEYVFQVQANDSFNVAFSVLRIKVADVNDIPARPDTENSTYFIYEGIPINTLLFYAHFHDLDATPAFSSVSYGLLNSNIFTVNENTGAVFLSKPLDYETQISALEFRVTGDGQQARYTVHILDANENQFGPMFNSQLNPSVLLVQRSLLPGAHIFTLNATDPDEGKTIAYDIVGGTGIGYFQIHENTGEITTAYSLASVASSELAITVRALDSSGANTMQSFHDLLFSLTNNVNSKPVFDYPVFCATPSENTAGLLHVVRATIDGSSNSVVYNISQGNEDSMFIIEPSTGAVLLSDTANLDRETRAIYNITLTGSNVDSPDSISEALLIIDVQDTDDFRPNFPTIDFNFTVFNSYPVGPHEPLARIFAVDNDLGDNGALSYGFRNLPSSYPFVISNTTGYIYIRQSFSELSMTEYEMTVTATGPSSHSFVTFRVIVLQTINGTTPIPSFLSPISLAENSISNNPITQVTISNSNSQVFYRIKEEDAKVYIHPNNGRVYLTRQLDYEEDSTVTYSVQILTGSSVPSTIPLTITVIDQNDNRPKFESSNYIFNISEADLTPNRFVGVIQATDRDSADITTLVYTIEDSTVDGIFEIDSHSGIIRLSSDSSAIDRENVPFYTFPISVSDSGTPPLLDFASVTVLVLDEDDNAPVFTPSHLTVYVKEDAELGQVIHTVAAFDPDLGLAASIFYELVTTADNSFLLNGTTGIITTAASLDAESQESYELLIRASSPHNLSQTGGILNLTVIVQDVLDSGPILTGPSAATIRENFPPFSKVAQIQSKYNARPVFYSIINGNQKNHFLIESVTGTVRTTTLLDREKISAYNLVIQGAYAVGYESNFTLAIDIADVNDEKPSFPSSFIRLEVPENSQPLVPLVNVNVTNHGQDGTLRFVITDSFAASIFYINSSGHLELQEGQQLDRESRFSSLIFEVYAISEISPGSQYSNQFTKALIYIEITDTNDPPVFDQTEYSFVVSTPLLLESPLFRIQATDLDRGANGELTYSLSGQRTPDIFSVDSGSGYIYISNTFMLQDVYTLTAVARDGGGLRATTSLNVSIRTCNFKGLTFTPSSGRLKVNVSESAAPGTVLVRVGELRVLDLRELDMNADVSFSFQQNSSHFAIHPTTGEITVLSLDRESQSSHSLVVQATDTADSSRLAQAEILVRVLDANDNAPQFTQPLYSQVITEEDLIESNFTYPVLAVRAFDQDIGLNSIVTYRLLGTSNIFRVEPTSGFVMLSASQELVPMGSVFQLTVEAIDRGEPPLSSTVTVTITIVDSRAPRFTMSLYSIQVSEGTPSNTPILNVTLDNSLETGPISFRILGESQSTPFSISSNGVLSVVDPRLDFETQTRYNLTLRARDVQNGLDGFTTLIVEVQDSNDGVPVFTELHSLYVQSVSENTALGTVVLEVEANDADSLLNAQITYELDTNDTDLFIIDQTGRISVNGELDFERTRTYEYSIYAIDSGTPALTGTAVLRFQIININDNPPTFRQPLYTTSIQETATAGPTELFVSASDPDHLDEITYDIVDGPGSSDFTISENGRLYLVMVNSSLTEYVLNISANDSAFYGYARVQVTIEGVNNALPTFNSSLYTGRVVENSGPGVFITQVFATDSDRGSNGALMYSLDDNHNFFSINANSGEITTSDNARSINRENTPFITTRVIATDGGSLSGAAQVRVTVEDINDNRPMFDRTVFFGFTPDNVMNNNVLTVQASDPDSGNNSVLSFAIQNLNSNFDLAFRIDSSTGVVHTFVSPQLQTQAHYQFNVTVRDLGSPSLESLNTALVDITITENNQSSLSFEESEYMATIFENIGFGSTVFHRVAVNTRNGTITCHPSTLTPDSAPFILVNNEILRVSTETLEPRTYELLITAQCLVSRVETTAVAVIRITVHPVNDPPRINELSYSGTISERNTVLPYIMEGVQVTATDPDPPNTPDGMIMYRLLNHNETFSIISDSGFILVHALVDYEVVSSYELLVEAYDQGEPSLTSLQTRIFVTVEDIDDNPPSFGSQEYTVEVFEDRMVGDLIFTASVMDVDTISTHTFAISGDVLSIGRMNGEVRLEQELDREQFMNYTATIAVRDATGSADTTLNLVILDANDNPPEFNSSIYRVTIEENFPIQVSFFQVFASDNDEGENAVIVFQSGDTFTDNITVIDNVTGELFFTRPPDYEMSEQFTLHVSATDIFGRWTTPGVIVVTLEDVNDNSPKFEQPSYMGEISENRPIGSTVIISNAERVVAMDADSGIRATLLYSIIGPAEEIFTITDGDIESQEVFDRERRSMYDLTVVATDMGSPSMSANVTVRIYITDQNDNNPVFSQPAYTITIPESTAIGTSVFTVAATDDDLGPNGEVRHYSLDGTFRTDFEAVTNANGSVTITVASTLDHEAVQKRQYQLIITAFDNGFSNGGRSREGRASLTINILDVDEHPPVFTMRFYTATIAEDAPLLTTIVQVEAQDRDASDSSQFTYTIRNAGNTPEFKLENNGTLVVEQSLDYERRTFYSLEVEVAGGVEPARVDITVTNINDNPPHFPSSFLNASIIENNQPNTLLIKLQVSDEDSDTNRTTFSIVAGDVDDKFEIGILGEVIVKARLDREDQSFYELIIMAEDNDSPSLSSNTTLLVQVLDVNDNPPVGGHQNIYIFPLFGSTPTISLGNVFVNDSDTDAVNRHTYNLLPGAGTDNILIQNNGSIRVNSVQPTAGTYFFTVTVKDTNQSSANTTINAYIRNISQDTLDHTFTMQLQGTTPQSFVDVSFGFFVDASTNILQERLKTELDVQVISIQQSASSSFNVDVTLAVLDKASSLYLAPLVVQHILHLNRARLPVTVATVSVDLCFQELCVTGTSCLNTHQYSIGEMALGSRSITYLGVTRNSSHECVDFLSSLCVAESCSSASSCVLSRIGGGQFEAMCVSSCASQPCRNEGTCVEQASGYYCQCPNNFEGRNCELTTARFVHTSYAIFPSLQGHTAGSISFEFNTGTSISSQLLYAGRFDGFTNDSLNITLEDGQACVLVSYGGEEKKKCVNPWSELSDRQWHRVTVIYGPTVSK